MGLVVWRYENSKHCYSIGPKLMESEGEKTKRWRGEGYEKLGREKDHGTPSFLYNNKYTLLICDI